MATIHRIIKTPEEFEVPRYPVREDDATGPTEDLDREPDGVPHAVIGFTAFFAFVFAGLVAVMFFSGTWTGHIGAALLIVFAVPLLVSQLKKKADRERDHVHPSR